jgi:hypothetical protein
MHVDIDVNPYEDGRLSADRHRVTVAAVLLLRN